MGKSAFRPLFLLKNLHCWVQLNLECYLLKMRLEIILILILILNCTQCSLISIKQLRAKTISFYIYILSGDIGPRKLKIFFKMAASRRTEVAMQLRQMW